MKKRSQRNKKCNRENTEKRTHYAAHSKSKEKKTAKSEPISSGRHKIIAQKAQTHVQVTTAQQVSEHALKEC